MGKGLPLSMEEFEAKVELLIATVAAEVHFKGAAGDKSRGDGVLVDRLKAELCGAYRRALVSPDVENPEGLTK